MPVAYIDYSGTQVAAVVEISVERSTGKIKVHNVWCAIDCGMAVQPDNVVAQTESSIVYGIGLALTERISIKDGAVEQSNFYDYIVSRNRDVPPMTCRGDPNRQPSDRGRSDATPLITPAVSKNAVMGLTSKRLRHAPFTEERVRRKADGLVLAKLVAAPLTGRGFIRITSPCRNTYIARPCQKAVQVNDGMCAIGTKRSSLFAAHMSAFGGKADIA